jgi:hypothetical protein
MRKRKTARGMVVSPAQLDKLIEEATVDCYNDEEQLSGFFSMMEDNLALPFATRVLGVEASVVAIEMDDERPQSRVCAQRRAATHRSDRSAASLAAAGRRGMDCGVSALGARHVGPDRGGGIGAIFGWFRPSSTQIPTAIRWSCPMARKLRRPGQSAAVQRRARSRNRRPVHPRQRASAPAVRGIAGAGYLDRSRIHTRWV